MICTLSEGCESAKATPFHHWLERLALEGRLLRLYSQNIDGIETTLPILGTKLPLSKKSPWPQTVLLHGTLTKTECEKCKKISNFQRNLFAGESQPSCDTCTGKLRPRVLLYDAPKKYDYDKAAIPAVIEADTKAQPDALLVVGTSLKIPAMQEFVRKMRGDGPCMWVNPDEPSDSWGVKWDACLGITADEFAKRMECMTQTGHGRGKRK